MSENKIDLSNDLMNMDLSSVQTSFPLVNPGIYPVRVAAISMVDNKEKTGKNIKIEFQITEAAVGVADGQPCEIKPGYPLHFNISLVQTEKYDPRQKLAQLMECFLGTKNAAIMPLEQFLNLEGTVKVGHSKATDQYASSAQVDRLIKRA